MGSPGFNVVVGRGRTKTQPLPMCILAFNNKIQWNLFEDLETLQSKKYHLLVSPQSDCQKKTVEVCYSG